MPLIRSHKDIREKLGDLTPAENRLMAACRAGEDCILGKTVPPEGRPDPMVHIRADLLRHLITGGCEGHPAADRGVDLSGAYITGPLDLNFASARGVTSLINCRFDNAITAVQVRLTLLSLNRSTLPGLNAQGAQVTGDVFLRQITAGAEVRLNSATIGGQLDCEGAKFNATTGDALNAQGAQVSDAVFLRQITAGAEVRLNSATIGGQLDCERANFNATTGFALNAQDARVAEGFFFQEVTSPQATIYLRGAQVGTLADDPQSWPPKGRLILEGFTYDRIVNTRFPKLTDRLDWLAKGDTSGREFFPQPYTQLAKVFREMGQDGDARDILFERERRLLRHRAAGSYTLPPPELVQGTPRAGVRIKIINYHVILWSFLFRTVVGYGYYPFRSVMILLALIGFSAVFADRTWQTGDFAPNSAHILISAEWRGLQATEPMPARVWAGEIAPANGPPARAWSTEAPGRDWETFNALAYGADIAIPLIEFGQTDAWAPSTSRGLWGKFLWWWRWVATVTGWVVTGLAAAAVTGIIRRD